MSARMGGLEGRAVELGMGDVQKLATGICANAKAMVMEQDQQTIAYFDAALKRDQALLARALADLALCKLGHVPPRS